MSSVVPVTENLPRGVESVRAVLRAAGLPGADRIQHIPDGARTAAEAAAAVGVDVGAIANSLVFVARTGDESEPILVMTSGAHRVDTALLAERIGVDEIGRAAPDVVRAATGQVIGGVAPVGHPAPLRTYLDPALEQYPELWAAAGHSHAVFPLSYDELRRITGGTVVAVN